MVSWASLAVAIAGKPHFQTMGEPPMKSYCAVAALAVVCSAWTVNAKEFKHEESGLQFKLPAGWTVTEKDNKIFFENKDKTLALVGGVIPADAAKAIFADIEKFAESIDGFDDVEVTDGPQKETVNELEQSWYEGTATVTDGTGAEKEIEWDMTIITGGKAVLFLVGTGAIEENEEAYDELFESIRKIPSDN